MFKRLMYKGPWAVGAGLLLAIGSVAVAGPASAAIPSSGAKLIWQDQPTRFCLGVARGDMTNGTPIIVWHCNRNADQTWTADSINTDGTSPFLLHNGANQHKCLTVGGMSLDNGHQLVISDCKATGANTDQLWTLSDSNVEDACTVFENVNSGKVMGVLAASPKEGASVVQWTDLSHNDQSWCSAPAPVN